MDFNFGVEVVDVDDELYGGLGVGVDEVVGVGGGVLWWGEVRGEFGVFGFDFLVFVEVEEVEGEVGEVIVDE